MTVRQAGRHVIEMPTSELVIHGFVAIAILVCATILGLHGEFNSGDLLAVFTMVGTGTATVAGARASNRNAQQMGITQGDLDTAMETVTRAHNGE